MAYQVFWISGALIGVAIATVVLYLRGVYTFGTACALAAGLTAFAVGTRLQGALELEGFWTALSSMSGAGFVYGPRRLPLGLLTGGLAAAAVGVVTRASLRDLGDALALGASALITIGRVGCFLNGCCTGAVCGPWAPHALCMAYGPGTETYLLQVATGVIPPGTPMSLPVHPLPLYFGVAALITFVALVVLFRRGAAPGTMLAVFCVVRPTTKLLFETLRMSTLARSDALMVAIPAGVLATTLATLLVLAVRRALDGRASSRLVPSRATGTS